jgi:virulence-associated protein E/primase-like protein/bifunctional DNA primase/polymerase-like protein
MNAEVIPFPTPDVVQQYLAHGWALCSIEPGTKGPREKNWNKRERALTAPPPSGWGVGLMHAYSSTCCLDFDDVEKATAWLADRGIDANALLKAPDAVRISSGRENRAKLLYKLDTPLRLKKVADGALELRCATATGTSCQDVLPSPLYLHPSTGRPYEWTFGDLASGDWRVLPDLPVAVRELWASLVLPTVPQSFAAGALDPEDEATATRMRDVLKDHDPDAPYDEWLRVGMALHHACAGAAVGLDAWDQWSSSGEKYQGREDLEKRWAGFKSDGPGPKVTFSSLTGPAKPDESLMDVIPATEPPRVRLAFARDKTHNLPTISNLEIALSRPDYTATLIAFDSFKDEIVLAPVGTQDWRPMRDEDITQFMLNFERAKFRPVDRQRLRHTLQLVAKRTTFDSAQIWLGGLTWDGKPRVARFLADYAGADDSPYTTAASFYLWTALAGRILEPGCQADMAPVLIGPQGARKTTAVRALVPDPDYFVEIDLGDRDDDLSRRMRGRLVGELSELQGLSKREVESVKTFMSRRHEDWVPKYMESRTVFARRIVFVGTTNQQQFLVDETGNRRWLPVRVTALDADRVAADREQLWAEGAAIWHRSGIAWQDAERLARPRHEEHRLPDAWEEAIRRWLDSSDQGDADALEHDDLATDDLTGKPPRSARPFTTADVQTGALGLTKAQMNSGTARRVAGVLTYFGYEQRRHGDTRRAWLPART